MLNFSNKLIDYYRAPRGLAGCLSITLIGFCCRRSHMIRVVRSDLKHARVTRSSCRGGNLKTTAQSAGEH